VAFDLLSTATFASAKVCVDVTGISFAPLPLRLLHYASSSWTDVTTDSANGIVCGAGVTTFSPFTVVARCPVPPRPGDPTACFFRHEDCTEIEVDLLIAQSEFDRIFFEIYDLIDRLYFCYDQLGPGTPECLAIEAQIQRLEDALDRLDERIRRLQAQLEDCRRRNGG
jgi:hypothetical protein